MLYIVTYSTCSMHSDWMNGPAPAPAPAPAPKESSYSAVVKISANILNYDWEQPYNTENVHQMSRTGFVIGSDINRGTLYILTVAHIIDNALDFWIEFPNLSSSGLGSNRFGGRILGIYLGCDIALIEIDFEHLDSATVLPMGAGDMIHYPNDLLALGYHNNVIVTVNAQERTGLLRLIGANEKDVVTPGSPLVDAENKIIGMVTCDGLAVPIDIFQKIKERLMKSRGPGKRAVQSNLSRKPMCNLIYAPTLGLSWANTTRLGNKFIGMPHECCGYGIQVTKLQRFTLTKKSGIAKGDILVKMNGHNVNNWGDLLHTHDGMERKITLDGFLRTLIPGEKISITFWSLKEQCFKSKSIAVSSTDHIYQIRERYPLLEPSPYIVWNGLTLMDLALQHLTIEAFSHLRYLGYEDHLDQGIVLVTSVRHGSAASIDRVIAPGELISSCNGKKVHTIKEMSKVLEAHNTDEVGLVTTTGKAYIVSGSAVTVH